MISRQQIVDEARSWIGVPFHHQGRNRLGVDCIGLVYLVGLTVGADLRGYIDDPTYGRDPDARLHRGIARHAKRLNPMPLDNPPPGSILFFAFAKLPQHVGIASDKPGFFIHSFEPDGRVTETRLDRTRRRLVRGIFDFHGVEQWQR